MPFPAESLSGQIFGRWRVLRRVADGAGKVVKWLCVCDPLYGGCGAEHAVSTGTLKGGRSNGCRKCAAFQRHRDNPKLAAHWRGPRPKNHKHACEACGKKFKGIARQRFYSLA